MIFGTQAFRTWGQVLMGACVFAVLFLGIMVLAEEVIGEGARLTRDAVAIGSAAFLGYIGTAWIVRREDPPSS